MSKSTATSYNSLAKFLHWSMAIVVIVAIILGIMIGNFGWLPVKGVLDGLSAITGSKIGPLKNQLYDLHRSFGALVLAMVALRIAWRIISPPPPLPETVTAFQRAASHAVHSIIYICLVSMPILGWLGTSLYGAKIKVFGLFVLPEIVAKDRASSGIVLDIHGWLGLAFAVVIAMHIGAALMHHFVHKDDILKRMLPGRNPHR